MTETTKESANRGLAATITPNRTETMVAALSAVDGIAPSVLSALNVASERYRNRPSNLTPNLAVAVLAARFAGMSAASYDASGNVLFGANRNRDGSILNIHAEPYLVIRPNGKGWHSRVANVQQDFPNGLKGTVEPLFLSFVSAVIAGTDSGDRYDAVRAIIESAADEDYAIRSAFLTGLSAK
jgi:hypothetical protein